MDAPRRQRWLVLALVAFFAAQSSAWASHGHVPGEEAEEVAHSCLVCENASDRATHVGATGARAPLPDETPLFAPPIPAAVLAHHGCTRPDTPRAPPCDDHPH